MKQNNIRDSLIFILIAVMFSSCFSQCYLDVIQNENKFLFFKVCEGTAIRLDSSEFIPPYRYPKSMKIDKKNVYLSWTFVGVPGGVHYLIKYSLDSNHKIISDNIHWCNQKDFEEKVEEKNCIEVGRNGIKILFEDKTIAPLKISYVTLEKELLQDILKKRKEKKEQGIPPRE